MRWRFTAMHTGLCLQLAQFGEGCTVNLQGDAVSLIHHFKISFGVGEDSYTAKKLPEILFA